MLSRVAQAFGLGGPAKDARWIARLADVTAGAVASKPALSLPPDAPLSKALKMMHAHGVGALHVTEMDGPLQVALSARSLPFALPSHCPISALSLPCRSAVSLPCHRYRASSRSETSCSSTTSTTSSAPGRSVTS